MRALIWIIPITTSCAAVSGLDALRLDPDDGGADVVVALPEAGADATNGTGRGVDAGSRSDAETGSAIEGGSEASPAGEAGSAVCTTPEECEAGVCCLTSFSKPAECVATCSGQTVCNPNAPLCPGGLRCRSVGGGTGLSTCQSD